MALGMGTVFVTGDTPHADGVEEDALRLVADAVVDVLSEHTLRRAWPELWLE